jgi:hypothetical protein
LPESRYKSNSFWASFKYFDPNNEYIPVRISPINKATVDAGLPVDEMKEMGKKRKYIYSYYISPMVILGIIMINPNII